MDTPQLKTLLAAQEQAYRSAMEILVKDISGQCKQLQTTVQDLRTSLEYSQKEVDDLKHQLNQLKQDDRDNKLRVTTLSEDLQASLKSIDLLKDRCNYQEDYNRRNNLQLVGIEEDPSETWEQSAAKVCHLFQDKLQLPNVQLERAHRMGQHYPNRHRPIIARFTRFCDREAVMRNLGKLRGSNIYINEDLCPASLEIKKAQLPLLRQAKSEGKIAYFRHTKLFIKDKDTNINRAVNVNGSRSSDVSSGAVSADVTLGAAPVVVAGAGGEAVGVSSGAVGGGSAAVAVGVTGDLSAAAMTAGADRNRSSGKTTYSSATRRTNSPMSSQSQGAMERRFTRRK